MLGINLGVNCEFICFDKPNWTLGLLADLMGKLKAFAESKGWERATLVSCEDCTEYDSVNQRYNIVVRYLIGEHVYDSWLLFLKGEIIDGKAFHKRYDEFYPENNRLSGGKCHG